MSNEDAKNKIVDVYLVNPPIQDPWRTREEYINEQVQSKWQFRLTIFALAVSIVTSFAATVSAYSAAKALSISNQCDRFKQSSISDDLSLPNYKRMYN